MRMKGVALAIFIVSMSIGIAAYSADLQLKSGTFIVITPAKGIDDKLCEIGKLKARQLDRNPICAFLNEQGHVSFGEGSKVSFKDTRYEFEDGDMIINAGSAPITLNTVLLNKGEYATADKGVIEKAKDVLTIQ